MTRTKLRTKIIRADRIFMGMPVRDAEQSILVQPLSGDIERGVQGDPENCAYAQCIRRMLKTSVVFVYHSVSYVQVLDERGNPVLERYLIKDGTKEYLENFDASKANAKPAGFKLKAPNYAMTLDYKAAQRRRYKREGLYEKWEAARAERMRTGKKVTKYKVSPAKTVGSFRNGTGCVRFIGSIEGRLAKRFSE